MTAPVVQRVGRFNVRLVPAGAPRYSGMTRLWDREAKGADLVHADVEIYDPQHPHTELGQFITAYRADTLADGRPGGRLSLNWDVPAWTMTDDETRQLRALAQEFACHRKRR